MAAESEGPLSRFRLGKLDYDARRPALHVCDKALTRLFVGRSMADRRASRLLVPRPQEVAAFGRQNPRISIPPQGQRRAASQIVLNELVRRGFDADQMSRHDCPPLHTGRRVGRPSLRHDECLGGGLKELRGDGSAHGVVPQEVVDHGRRLELRLIDVQIHAVDGFEFERDVILQDIGDALW